MMEMQTFGGAGSPGRPLVIVAADPASPEALQLMAELSAILEAITGDGGRNSFKPEDVAGPRGRFVIARAPEGAPLGCGAIRPLDEAAGIAEVKRMYARPGAKGVGSAILAHLEEQARGLGYAALWLETRLVNQRAVAFYERRGYRRIPNYGGYVGRPQSVCFEKRLRED
jgi:GNAT superfamily N-acetyltransferase